MKSDLANFYGTTAQVIPALVLILVIETTFMSAVLRYKGLWEAGMGGLATLRLVDRLKRGQAFPLGGVERLIVRLLAALVDAFFLRPTRGTNSVLVLVTILLSVVAEALAFVGLAFDISGDAKIAVVAILLTALGVLLVQVFLSLVMSVFAMLNNTASSPTSAPPTQNPHH